MFRGNFCQDARQAFRPEHFLRAEHIRDGKDGGRYTGIPQDGIGIFVVISPAVIKRDRAGLLRQGLASGLARKPVGELDKFKIAGQ